MSYLDRASRSAAHVAWEAARTVLAKHGCGCHEAPEDLDDQVEAAIAEAIKGYTG